MAVICPIDVDLDASGLAAVTEVRITDRCDDDVAGGEEAKSTGCDHASSS